MEPTRNPAQSPTKSPEQQRTESPSPGDAASGAPSAAPVSKPPSTRAPSSAPKGGDGGDGSAAGKADPDEVGVNGEFCEAEFVRFPLMDGFIGSSYLFAGLGLFFSCAGITFMIVFRNKPVLLMSQRVLLTMFCVGLAITNLSLIVRVRGVQAPSSGRCVASSTLLYFGLTLAVSCLSVKEWRSWRVYTRTMQMRQIKLDNRALLGYIALTNLVTVVLVVVWMAVFPPTVDVCGGFRCSYPSAVLSYLVFCYVVILTVVAIVLAYMSRDVPSVGGESAGILITASFSFFAIVLVGIISISGTVTLQIETWLLCFTVFWCSMMALCLIVFKKWFWFRHSSQELQALYLRTDRSSGPFGRDSRATYTAPNLLHGQPFSGQSSTRGISTGDPQQVNMSDYAAPPSSRLPKPFKSRPHTTNTTASNTASTSSSAEAFNPAADIIATDLDTGNKVVTDGARQKAGIVLPSLPLEPAAAAAASESGALPQASARAAPVAQPEGGASPRGESSAAVDSAALQAALDAHRSRGFKIGQEGDWEEFVDRETGESFWLDTRTGLRAFQPPTGLALV